ncbi:MAG: dephospho-CoA kinase [Bacteroidota bacterium]|nr:dephospho-CoA kinase [Bacteroidota bacterium]
MTMKSSDKTLIVGITGGIGSGKSEVCNLFQSFGAKVLYTDLMARELIDTRKDIQQKIKQILGADIFLKDGTLNRKIMAEYLFHDKKLKAKINHIVHPQVIGLLKSEIRRAKSIGDSPLLVIESALIFDANVRTLFDFIIVVHADRELRIQRISKRDGCSRDAVEDRINSQMPADEILSLADFIIWNTDNKKSLKGKARFLFDVLTTMKLY